MEGGGSLGPLFDLVQITSMAYDVLEDPTVILIAGACLAAAVGMALVKWGVRSIPRAFRR